MIRPIVIAAALVTLTACAGTSSEYACPGMPSQPLCLPTTEIYRLSDGLGPPPAAERRPSLIVTEHPPAAGGGWVWSTRLWN